MYTMMRLVSVIISGQVMAKWYFYLGYSYKLGLDLDLALFRTYILRYFVLGYNLPVSSIDQVILSILVFIACVVTFVILYPTEIKEDPGSLIYLFAANVFLYVC